MIAYEMPESRAAKEAAGNKAEQTFVTFVDGEGVQVSEDAAAAAAAVVIPAVYRDLIPTGYDAKPIAGGRFWVLEWNYRPPEHEDNQPQPTAAGGEEIVNFDTTGGSVRITRSLETRGKYKASETDPPLPDYRGAIAVASDGGKDRIEGAEIVISKLTFGVRRTFAQGYITDNYVKTLEDLTGTVNDAPFRGRDALAVLFLGARGSAKLRGEVSVEFVFLSGKNLDNVTIGDIPGITKKAHDVIWWLHKEDIDPSAAARVLKAVGAYVERVYDPADFSQLGINTSLP